MSANIAFLLGAGAVVEAGLPASVGLADNIHHYLSTRADTDEVEALHLQLIRFLDGGIRFQRGVLGQDPRAPVNIEQLATAALRLKNRTTNPIAPYVSGWNGRLVELEEKRADVLDRFADLMFDRLREELATPGVEEIAYLTHFGLFLQLGSVSVFSLNYDLCLETALTSVSTDFQNGFTERGWEPGTLMASDGLRIIKLHGSLDWVDDSEFGICSLEFPEHPSSTELSGQAPLIIFGTDSKVTATEPFLSQLYHFSLTLNACDILAIIGYSFGDDYINDVIHQRFSSNTRMHVFVVDPCENSNHNIARMPALDGSPRLTVLARCAKDALQNNVLYRCMKKRIEQAGEDTPFGGEP